MTIHRFYLAPSHWMGAQPMLDSADSHHCADVLRLGVGDKVVIFDGEGNEAAAILAEVSRKRTRLDIGHRTATAKPRCAITLAQAVPKARNMDLIIQKAVELGASSVVPILSERTVVRLEDAGDAAKKQERWQSIAIEACKQCGQNWTPKVGLPQTIKEFLTNLPKAELILIASLQPDARRVKQVLSDFVATSGVMPGSVIVMVGPEGDFTPAETLAAKTAGAAAISLGPIIMRTETAAFYCLSILGHELF